MSQPLIDKSELCGLIPHAGSMCLLDGVDSWDPEQIRCHSRSHLAADNPLREHGILAAVHALEYGAQAMAVHGGLLARADGGALRPGVLAGLRDVRLHAERLDDEPELLQVQARRLLAGGDSFLYQFEVRLGARLIASARATVIASGAAP